MTVLVFIDPSRMILLAFEDEQSYFTRVLNMIKISSRQLLASKMELLILSYCLEVIHSRKRQ